MSAAASSPASDPLTRAMRLNLQMHLVNHHHKGKSSICDLGTEKQLSSVARISNSDKVSACFDASSKPTAYPDLPKRSYLVLCVDHYLEVNVCAAYTLKQFQALAFDMQLVRKSPLVRSVAWRVLELPEKLETDLLSNLSLKRGYILGDDNEWYPICKI